MIFKIPDRKPFEIKNVLLDFNGTMAIDGKLIAGVGTIINELAASINFYVITADTFGSVEKELSKVNCRVVIIAKDNQDVSKRDYLLTLGKEKTMCVGNGQNDALMLKEAVIGIALIQDEGVCVDSLLAADVACKSILDVFDFFKSPDRIKATLRN